LEPINVAHRKPKTNKYKLENHKFTKRYMNKKITNKSNKGTCTLVEGKGWLRLLKKDGGKFLYLVLIKFEGCA
jgi:phage gp16-like protein